MPMYEYECDEHGRFEQLRPLSEYAAPAPCPTCELGAPRVVSVPHLCALPRSTMVAHARNEKSCHEPALHRAPADKPQSGAPPALRSSRGLRPWVIEHGS
jgi:putative FmdB family regulatory protein